MSYIALVGSENLRLCRPRFDQATTLAQGAPSPLYILGAEYTISSLGCNVDLAMAQHSGWRRRPSCVSITRCVNSKYSTRVANNIFFYRMRRARRRIG